HASSPWFSTDRPPGRGYSFPYGAVLSVGEPRPEMRHEHARDILLRVSHRGRLTVNWSTSQRSSQVLAQHRQGRKTMKNKSHPIPTTESERRPRAIRILCLLVILSLALDAAAQKPPQPPAPTPRAPSSGSFQSQITVRLRHANESPLDVPAMVWLRSISSSVNLLGSALSGEAVFRGLRPGQYVVEAEAPGYAKASETIML